MGRIKITKENCTGCKACMMTCSMKNEKVGSYKLARIKIKKDEEIELATPVVCRQCKNAECADSCPMLALTRDENTGAIVFNSEKCVGCELCVDNCPFGTIYFNKETNKPYKCDLCNGDPQCVKVCKLAGAIRYDQ